jgi:hypothetical protein
VARDLDFASWDAYPLNFLAPFLYFRRGMETISFVPAIQTSAPSTMIFIVPAVAAGGGSWNNSRVR